MQAVALRQSGRVTSGSPHRALVMVRTTSQVGVPRPSRAWRRSAAVMVFCVEARIVSAEGIKL